MKFKICMTIFLLLIVFCTPEDAEKETLKKAIKVGMIEITSFKLNQNVSIETFTELANTMQKNFLLNQEGFITRNLTLSEDSTWIDIVYWENERSFELAMKKAESSEAVAPFIEKINIKTIKMTSTKPILLTNECD
ncbi:MAG: hypothetical protein JJT78_05895 [Leptospira sp.]|nr:hypothetical protein [Leptospira sp.]